MNSRDRQLTNAAVRKLMYGNYKEDVYGEEYVRFFSAKNFYKNMRDYYARVAEMYMRNPGEEDSIEEIIESMPPTGGWLTLIVEDLEDFTGDPGRMEEMFKTFIKFAAKRTNVILIGNGDCNDVFCGCGYAVGEMKTGMAAKAEDNLLMIGSIAQDETEEVTCGASAEELDFYWDMMNDQLEDGYLDYDGFKVLYKDTLEYLIPRVTEKQVYRQDLRLIENIGRFKLPPGKETDGCEPWELEAAKKFTRGLNSAVINADEDNDDFSEGTIKFRVSVEDRKVEYGAVHISGSFEHTENIRADNALSKMDKLADVIRKCSYEGDGLSMLDLMYSGEDENDEDAEKRIKKAEETHKVMGALINAIKRAADETVNRAHGRKVRRHKQGPGYDSTGNMEENNGGAN